MTETIKRNFIVVTDAAADLPPAEILKDRYDVEPIPQMPLSVTFEFREGIKTFTSGIDLSDDEYRAIVLEQEQVKNSSDRVIPKTAAKSPEYYKKIYKELAKNGLEILSVNIGHNVSSVIENAKKAAEAFSPNQVFIFDSGATSMAEGLMAIYAEKMAANGATREQTIAMLNDLKTRTTLRVITPNMPYLESSGRVSHIKNLFGSMLHINPIIQIDHNLVNEVARRSTTNKALDWMVDYMKEEIKTAEQIAILEFERPKNDDGSSAKKYADILVRRLVDEAGVSESIIYSGKFKQISPSHSGPGTLAMITVKTKN